MYIRSFIAFYIEKVTVQWIALPGGRAIGPSQIFSHSYDNYARREMS